MDVKTVCLGMLTSGPASGYDLKKFFESTFGHFFAASYGSIYPALASLSEQDLVLCEEIPQEGKPDRKVYSITDDGRAELDRALKNPTPGHKIRSEFLAMLFFAHLMSDEQIDAVLDNRVAEVEEFLSAIDQLDMSDSSCWPEGTRFVAGFGKAMATTCKRYIAENRDMLTGSDDKNIRQAHGWR